MRLSTQVVQLFVGDGALDGVVVLREGVAVAVSASAATLVRAVVEAVSPEEVVSLSGIVEALGRDACEEILLLASNRGVRHKFCI